MGVRTRRKLEHRKAGAPKAEARTRKVASDGRLASGSGRNANSSSAWNQDVDDEESTESEDGSFMEEFV